MTRWTATRLPFLSVTPPRPMPDPARPCQAEVLPGQNDVDITRSTEGAQSGNRTGGAPCGWGGGNDSDDRVFEYAAPEDGVYDITVTNAELSPILTVRANDCKDPNMLQQVLAEGEEDVAPACGSDADGVGQTQLTVELEKDDRIAIIVDGAGGSAGGFDLSVRRRQPDLVIESLQVPASAMAGETITVSASIRNSGDGNAGAFRVRFIVSRDPAGVSMLGESEAACTISGVGPKQTIGCTSSTALPVPLVTEGAYFVVATADDLDLVRESSEDNNRSASSLSVSVRGVDLQQQLFRAADGTTYQLLRAVPTDVPNGLQSYRVTGLASAAAGLNTCTPQSVGGTKAIIGANALFDFAAIRKTAVIEPNATDIATFNSAGSGQLTVGAGLGGTSICSEATDCSETPSVSLVSLVADSGGVPEACVAGAVPNALCEGLPVGSQLAFGVASGGVPPVCTNLGAVTVENPPCEFPPADGFTLEAGQVVVFVYGSSLEGFSIAAAAFGISNSEQGVCPAGRVVDGAVLRNDSGSLPLLTFIESVGVGSQSALESVAVSSDGQHVYVSDRSGIVTVYDARMFGQLPVLVEEQRQGVGGVVGIKGATAILASLDGNAVYVAGTDENALAVFSRNDSTGRLTEVEVQRDEGLGGQVRLLGVRSLAESPGGEHLYAFGGDFRFPNPAVGSTLTAFSRNASTGRLTFAQGVEILGDNRVPRAAAVSADGANVYVVGDISGGVVGYFLKTYSRDAVTGVLTEIDVHESGVGGVGDFGAGGVAVSGDGSYVYVSGRSGDNIAYFSRDGVGALTYIQGQEFGSLLGGEVANIQLSQDSSILYGTSADSVVVFSRNVVSGALSLDQVLSDGASGVDGLASVGSLSLSPNGAFSVSAIDRALVKFEFVGNPGALKFIGDVEVVAPQEEVVPEFNAIAVSPDGFHLYGGEGGSGGQVVLFDRDQTDGSLRLVGAQADRAELDGIDELTVSSDGSIVRAISFGSQMAVEFVRNATDGTLSFSNVSPGSFDSTLTSVCGGSPEVCYTAMQSSPLNVMLLITENGRPVAFDDSSFDENLRALNSIAINPLGQDAYFTTGVLLPKMGELNSLSFSPPFGNNPPDRAFTSVVVSAPSTPSVTGARRVITSRLGKFVFVTAAFDFGAGSVNPGSLLAFERESSLVLRQSVTDGEGRVEGLSGADAVVATGDGRNVYVVGESEGAIVVFLLNRRE